MSSTDIHFLSGASSTCYIKTRVDSIRKSSRRGRKFNSRGQVDRCYNDNLTATATKSGSGSGSGIRKMSRVILTAALIATCCLCFGAQAISGEQQQQVASSGKTHQDHSSNSPKLSPPLSPSPQAIAPNSSNDNQNEQELREDSSDDSQSDFASESSSSSPASTQAINAAHKQLLSSEAPTATTPVPTSKNPLLVSPTQKATSANEREKLSSSSQPTTELPAPSSSTAPILLVAPSLTKKSNINGHSVRRISVAKLPAKKNRQQQQQEDEMTSAATSQSVSFADLTAAAASTRSEQQQSGESKSLIGSNSNSNNNNNNRWTHFGARLRPLTAGAAGPANNLMITNDHHVAAANSKSQVAAAYRQPASNLNGVNSRLQSGNSLDSNAEDSNGNEDVGDDADDDLDSEALLYKMMQQQTFLMNPSWQQAAAAQQQPASGQRQQVVQSRPRMSAQESGTTQSSGAGEQNQQQQQAAYLPASLMDNLGNSKKVIKLLKSYSHIHQVDDSDDQIRGTYTRVNAIRRPADSQQQQQQLAPTTQQYSRQARQQQQHQAKPSHIYVSSQPMSRAHSAPNGRHYQTTGRVQSQPQLGNNYINNNQDEGNHLDPSQGEVPQQLDQNGNPINNGEDDGSNGGSVGPGQEEDDFECPNNGIFADVASGCQSYHVCQTGAQVQEKFQCPLGTLFNDIILTCDFAHNVQCGGKKPQQPVASSSPLPRASQQYPQQQQPRPSQMVPTTSGYPRTSTYQPPVTTQSKPSQQARWSQPQPPPSASQYPLQPASGPRTLQIGRSQYSRHQQQMGSSLAQAVNSYPVNQPVASSTTTENYQDDGNSNNNNSAKDDSDDSSERPVPLIPAVLPPRSTQQARPQYNQSQQHQPQVTAQILPYNAPPKPQPQIQNQQVAGPAYNPRPNQQNHEVNGYRQQQSLPRPMPQYLQQASRQQNPTDFSQAGSWDGASASVPVFASKDEQQPKRQAASYQSTTATNPIVSAANSQNPKEETLNLVINHVAPAPTRPSDHQQQYKNQITQPEQQQLVASSNSNKKQSHYFASDYNKNNSNINNDNKKQQILRTQQQQVVASNEQQQHHHQSLPPASLPTHHHNHQKQHERVQEMSNGAAPNVGPQYSSATSHRDRVGSSDGETSYNNLQQQQQVAIQRVQIPGNGGESGRERAALRYNGNTGHSNNNQLQASQPKSVHVSGEDTTAVDTGEQPQVFVARQQLQHHQNQLGATTITDNHRPAIVDLTNDKRGLANGIGADALNDGLLLIVRHSSGSNPLEVHNTNANANYNNHNNRHQPIVRRSQPPPPPSSSSSGSSSNGVTSASASGAAASAAGRAFAVDPQAVRPDSPVDAQLFPNVQSILLSQSSRPTVSHRAPGNSGGSRSYGASSHSSRVSSPLAPMEPPKPTHTHKNVDRDLSSGPEMGRELQLIASSSSNQNSLVTAAAATPSSSVVSSPSTSSTSTKQTSAATSASKNSPSTTTVNQATTASATTTPTSKRQKASADKLAAVSKKQLAAKQQTQRNKPKQKDQVASQQTVTTQSTSTPSNSTATNSTNASIAKRVIKRLKPAAQPPTQRRSPTSTSTTTTTNTTATSSPTSQAADISATASTSGDNGRATRAES